MNVFTRRMNVMLYNVIRMVHWLICMMIRTRAFFFFFLNPAFVHTTKHVDIPQDPEKLKFNSGCFLYHILHLHSTTHITQCTYFALYNEERIVMNSSKTLYEDLMNMFMNKSNRTETNQFLRYCN